MKSRRTRRADSPETSSGFSKFFGSLLTQGDQSRLGRDYLQTGMLMEITFPQYDVRFIAVNDGVDSENGVSDFSASRIISTIFMPEIQAARSERYRERRGNAENGSGQPFRMDI